MPTQQNQNYAATTPHPLRGHQHTTTHQTRHCHYTRSSTASMIAPAASQLLPTEHESAASEIRQPVSGAKLKAELQFRAAQHHVALMLLAALGITVGSHRPEPV